MQKMGKIRSEGNEENGICVWNMDLQTTVCEFLESGCFTLEM